MNSVLALTWVTALSFTAVGIASPVEARAMPALHVEQANPTITINTQSAEPPYVYSPAEVSAKVGQAITITNNDPYAVHSVTANDRSFSVDVPPKSSVTLTVSKPGNYPYSCTYHPGQHNPASLKIS